ncbi:major facilitator superfamily MFS-1 [Annulohypoxylon maeteangense]|uniref:major facilitator superfamily MFS-1 n=1 Tax=Annulohypoxylon maeteangense TaxID=1927788 RepID=UPI00200733A6|nr:major facilitator superfamily MFS-1 [Annulohypoxylon maeteangense]KAI0882003.1 major facilitator superfamily MFS-1 [Annulohypoxylon maeteangense]
MDSDQEKATLDVEEVERKKTPSTDTAEEEFSEEEGKRIIWRVDRRLVTLTGLLYCISLMDRTNLAAGAVSGMLEDLDLVGTRYSIVTLVFFITYILFQPPSTVLTREIGPRIYLPSIILAWGAVMIGFGFSPSYQVLLALRIILGVFEAGYFPGCVYLLSTWYTRYEVGRRYSVFYLLGCVASACSGILAFGLIQMNGVAGLPGWRWIFIIEGVLTCLLSFIGYWLLVDFPDSKRKSWRFLNERERAWIIRRVKADRGDTEVPKFKISLFLGGGLDLRVWGYGLIAYCTNTMTYSLAYFLPLILHTNLGFSVGASQCLIAPPYAFAGIWMYGMGWIGDRYRIRGPIVVANMILALIGLPILGWHPNDGIRYFGAFLVTAGANSNIPGSLSYQANNIRGQWKRAFSSALWVGFASMGGITGSLVFRSQDAATGYKPGLWACIACCLFGILLVGILDLSFYFDNKKADRGEKELEITEEDYQPGFRYTY